MFSNQTNSYIIKQLEIVLGITFKIVITKVNNFFIHDP